MESISKKIVDLEKKNIILKTDGLKLSYEAPKDKINKEILDFLKENKSEIIKLLLNDTTEKWNSMGIYESKSFPLTDTQAAYLMGREECFSYGNVGCHIYFEIEYSCLDFNQVQNVWNELLERHEMLRMEITADKKQIISEIVPKNIVTFWDTTNETEDQILSMVREKFGNKQYNIYKAPLFDVGVISREKKNDILFLSVEMMVADWTSIWLLVKEFEDIYFGKKTLPILNSSFRRYVDFLLAEKESVAFYRDLEFWKSKIERIPEAPCLPTVEQAYDSNRFKHFSHSLNRDSWEKVVAYSKKYGITPTVAVLQVYVQIIRMWSSNKDFSLNLTMMNRNNLHSDLENIVGDFTELCVLECFNLETDTFVESARILQKQLFDNLDHKAFSGIKVLRELNKEKGIDKALMPYVFTSAVGLVGKTLESNFVGRMNEFGVSQTPQVFIDCQVMDDLEGLRIFWDVREGIFPDGLVEDMFFLFGKQIDKMEKECFWTQEDIVELPEWQKQVRNSVNNTVVKRELYRIEEGIIYSCRNNPNKIALVDKERSFTYQETLEYAMVIKSELEKKNCKVGDYVGIMVNKSAFQVIAAIGILCTGAIFVPISSDLPSERKRKIIQNSNIHIIVLDIPLTESIEVQDVVYVDELFRDQKIIESAKLLENTQSAYVIYTSGSTGEPKGVEISHESVMNTILDMNERLSITENDVFIAISKMNFDLSIYDMFGCLIAGATLVIPDDDTVNPERWAELINHYGVTIWNSVPALMQILFVNEEAKGCKRISSLRNILLSGDWIPIDLPARIYEFLPDTRIISLGGATEASIWSVYHECNINEQYKKSIPYGKPLSNQTLYIWDENMRDCPIGVKGDLFIGGIGLAKGYMNSSDLTAQKFIVKGGERFYRTGDKGRYLLGGEIEFLGREDMQVKINGYRIELGEIESILCNYEPIYQAVVSVIKNKLLVAAVVFHNGSNASEADILIYLKMHLPQYMIPKKIVVWDSFPLTFNGKIDRKRIDENYSIEEMQKHMEGMSVDNNSANELLLMWREALHNSEIQLQDNLYDYGVDSLIMAQMASKIRNNYTKNEIPFDVLLRQLLNHPDVLSLYQYIENYSMPDKKLVQNIKNDGIGTINIFHENKNDTLQVLLHAGFGTMNCFRYLIEYMRLDNKGTIAGIAIKNSKRYCEMNPDNLIEILADEYVNLIIGLNKKKIQIIGYCISGLIAVEIARRLMERGLEIFDLVLIDSHPIQYQLEDELLMEITFLPSLGIEISQLGLGEISNEELYKAVLYLYNEFKKEIPSRSIQYLPDEYINLKKILLKLDCMEKRQRFELYSKMALEKAENQFPVDMCIDLFAAYKQSFKAAQFVPEVYAGNIRFLLAEESTSFIPDNDEETLAFWKNTCLDDMSVEMIKGNHITCTENKENACTLCKKISKCFQD